MLACPTNAPARALIHRCQNLTWPDNVALSCSARGRTWSRKDAPSSRRRKRPSLALWPEPEDGLFYGTCKGALCVVEMAAYCVSHHRPQAFYVVGFGEDCLPDGAGDSAPPEVAGRVEGARADVVRILGGRSWERHGKSIPQAWDTTAWSAMSGHRAQHEQKVATASLLLLGCQIYNSPLFVGLVEDGPHKSRHPGVL